MEHGCRAAVTGGVVFADSANPSEIPDDLTQSSNLCVPDQLSIHSERPGGELFQDAVQAGGADRIRLQIFAT
ncbi:MAG: hypothetical protein O3A00_09635 [Planctomycetota bacterium]|nr:hypothetical protein [Planctomycetota bacterium]